MDNKDNKDTNGTRKVKLSELEKESNNTKIIDSNIKNKSKNKNDNVKDNKDNLKNDSNKEKVTKDNKETKEENKGQRKVVPLSEVAKQNQDKLKTNKDSNQKSNNDTNEEKESKSKKVTLDELIKQTKEKETKKKNEEDVIVNFNDKKKETKTNKKNNNQGSNSKSKAHELSNDDVKSIKNKSKEISKREKKEEENEEVIKDVNLDVLGVKRKHEPSIILTKIKETVITILLLILGLFLIMILPIFNVKDENINITGLDLINREEILDAMNYNKSKNLFHILLGNPEEKIIENVPMVNDCELKYEFPNMLNIRITEIRIAGYIPYLNEYIYIDSDGRVVASQSEMIEGIPLIEGLNFNSLKVGNVLKVSNSEALKIIIELTNVLNKYNLSNNISSIDVTSLDNLKLYVGNIEVNLGDIEDYDQKIRMAMEAIKQLSPEARGELNVTNSSGRIYFMPYS